jgi:sn-glycerol 3-phosphate transport system substrate-binding protein
MKAKSRAQELASYEFLKFMASAEIQRRWHARTGYFPIRKDVLESLKAEGFYEKYAVAWTAIEQMRSSPATAATQGALTTAFPELRENVMTAIEEILSDTSDIPVALEKAKKRTDFTLLREAKYAEPP